MNDIGDTKGYCPQRDTFQYAAWLYENTAYGRSTGENDSATWQSI
jgi:hypothetical protein